MTFASPLWLLGLLPWAALGLWLLTGQHPRAPVPFLAMWKQGPIAAPKARASLQVPPLAVILILISILLAITGAARPFVRAFGNFQGPPITIIIDRGITMSAKGQTQARWKELLEPLRSELLRQFGQGQVDLLMVPDGKPIQTDRDHWCTQAQLAPLTAADTRTQLPQTVQTAMSRDERPVIVLTDQTLQSGGPRLVLIEPQTLPQNVGIVMAGASLAPHPAVMVRVRNDSVQTAADLKVGSIVQRIDLPAFSQERNYFVELDHLDASTPIDLSVPRDDQPVDNHIELVQQRSWPQIRVQGVVSAEVLRMVEVYGKLRPPASTGSSLIIIAPTPTSSDLSTVIVPLLESNLGPAALQVEPHPINTSVDWSMLSKQTLRVAGPPAGAGWRSIVRRGDHDLVKVRDEASRQVWIGFSSDAWPRSSDFVVFWTNVLDWVGQGGESFALKGATCVPIPAIHRTDGRQKLRLVSLTWKGGSDLSFVFLGASVLLIFCAFLAWGTCKNCAVG